MAKAKDRKEEKAMTPDDVMEGWKAAYKELFPARNAEHMRYDDSTMALAIYMSRLIDRALKTRVIEPAFAEGAEVQTGYLSSRNRSCE